MISNKIHIDVRTGSFHPAMLEKGTWITLLHASRIPPHAGLIIDGNYHSLTIKDRELNIPAERLLKTISLKKISSIFIRVSPHPVFSSQHLSDMYQEQMMQFECVKANEATCLSPIKIFFNEFYGIPHNEDHLLFDFLKELADQQFLELACSPDNGARIGLELPYYTKNELNELIKSETQNLYKD